MTVIVSGCRGSHGCSWSPLLVSRSTLVCLLLVEQPLKRSSSLHLNRRPHRRSALSVVVTCGSPLGRPNLQRREIDGGNTERGLSGRGTTCTCLALFAISSLTKDAIEVELALRPGGILRGVTFELVSESAVGLLVVVFLERVSLNTSLFSVTEGLELLLLAFLDLGIEHLLFLDFGTFELVDQFLLSLILPQVLFVDLLVLGIPNPS